MACHDPHGSDSLFLANNASIIDLCGKCHDWQKHSTHPIGEKVKDPRNKNLNVQLANVTTVADNNRLVGALNATVTRIEELEEENTKAGDRLLNRAAISAVAGGVRASTPAAEWPACYPA